MRGKGKPSTSGRSLAAAPRTAGRRFISLGGVADIAFAPSDEPRNAAPVALPNDRPAIPSYCRWTGR